MIGEKEDFEVFGYVECMNGKRLTKIIKEVEVKSIRERGRLCTRWLKGVKEAQNVTALKLRDAKMICIDEEIWRELSKGTSLFLIVEIKTGPTFDLKQQRSALQHSG